jgi:hypothetical protein
VPQQAKGGPLTPRVIGQFRYGHQAAHFERRQRADLCQSAEFVRLPPALCGSPEQLT